MSEDRSPGRSSWQPRYTLATLLLAMTIFSALAAGIYYGLRAVERGFAFEGMLVVLTLCAPPLLLFALKAGQWLLRWIDPPRND